MTNTTDPRTTAPAITIEYRDGRPAVTLPYDDNDCALESWEQITEGSVTGIQFAQLTITTTRGKGWRTYGTYGTPAAEMPAPKTADELNRERRAAEAAAGVKRERALLGRLADEDRADRARRRRA